MGRIDSGGFRRVSAEGLALYAYGQPHIANWLDTRWNWSASRPVPGLLKICQLGGRLVGQISVAELVLVVPVAFIFLLTLRHVVSGADIGSVRR
jgi:hypothetical protein